MAEDKNAPFSCEALFLFLTTEPCHDAEFDNSLDACAEFGSYKDAERVERVVFKESSSCL